MTEKNEVDQSIFYGAERILHGLPKMATAIVGLSGFAYIVGWAYSRAYFDVFGAAWLRSELPILTLLSYSWWPVIIVLFFAYLGITDLAETENKEILESSSRFKQSRFILNYGRWAFILIFIADIIIGEFGYPRIGRIISWISIFIVVAMATSAVELLAFRLSNPNLKFNLPVVRLTYVIIAFGLFYAPNQMGRNAALEDKNMESSRLPIVTINNDTSEFRLLLSSGDRFYIIPSTYETKYPPVKIIGMKEIQTIQKKENKKKPNNTEQ